MEIQYSRGNAGETSHLEDNRGGFSLRPAQQAEDGAARRRFHSCLLGEKDGAVAAERAAPTRTLSRAGNSPVAETPSSPAPTTAGNASTPRWATPSPRVPSV